MAAETHTFTPVKLFAGDFPKPFTNKVTVLSGENVAQYEIVASDITTGKVIAHPGVDNDFVADTSAASPTKNVDTTPKVAGIMVNAVDATAGDLAGNVWESGCFFADKLVWPANVTTDDLKRKLLEGSMIKVVFQDLGEV